MRPECDQPESPDDDAEIRIGRGLKYPKDRGYGKVLETLGYDRNWAGMLAAMIVEEGRVRAATARKNSEFAQALRRLGNPRLETEAFLAHAKMALEAMSGTVLTRGLFDGLRDSMGFYSFARSGFVLPAICRTDLMSPGLRRPFGAASPFHAVRSSPMLLLRMSIFLESQSIYEPAAFAWSPEEEDFTDRLTQATREEFDDPDFNPVPARRRLRVKQG